MSVSRMSFGDSLAVLVRVVLPTLAKGVLVRRPRMLALAERLDLDARAVKEMQRLRSRYGEGLLLIRNPVRPQALVMKSEDAWLALQQAPSPYSPASDEKRSALGHFEPGVSLISTGGDRKRRRRLNEIALESHAPCHHLGATFSRIVDQEITSLADTLGASQSLGWGDFAKSWTRLVRRIVLGDRGRDDVALTQSLTRLRSRGNWAFAAPKLRDEREAFHALLGGHLARAEPGSLAACAAREDAEGMAAPTHQIAHWLFAFDPAGMSTARTLALLSLNPQAMAMAQREAASSPSDLSFLRACISETIRLYPTTPAILRQTDRAVNLAGVALPKGAGLLIYTPFFHRDDERLEQAHRFEPERWLGRDPDAVFPFLPFSTGPSGCPARHLVPYVGALTLAALLRRWACRLERPREMDPMHLPGTLDHLTLRFGLSPPPR